MSDGVLQVRLVVADSGSFHDLLVDMPAETVGRYERLIDAIREAPEITGSIFVDPRRLVAAWVVRQDTVA